MHDKTLGGNFHGFELRKSQSDWLLAAVVLSDGVSESWEGKYETRMD